MSKTGEPGDETLAPGPQPHEADEVAGFPRPGDLVLAGKYRLEKELGAGGMGIVFAARHTTLKQQVAIKVLRTSVSDAEGAAVQRFLREAQAAATLRGDHVVRVSDVGRLEDGTPYILMEHLTGKDLGQLLQEGPVPVADAIGYVLEACEALIEAHTAGIVHRDLKPSNLFLTDRPDGSKLLKVLDFGISKMARDETSGSSTLTSPGAILGSPLYMSPEQIRSSSDVDARTDIWSLGMVLHELITGRPMFDEPTFSAICAKIVADPPVALRAVCPDAPEALEQIILRCLEKSPSARFDSVRDLKAALQAVRVVSFSSFRAGSTEAVDLSLADTAAHSPLARTFRSTTSSDPPPPPTRRRLPLVAGLLFGAFVVGFVVLHRQAATAAGAASPDPGLGASPAVVPTVDPGANAKPGASPSADPRPEPSVATPTTITAAPFVEGGLVGAASAAVLLAVVDAGAGRARPTAPRQMRPVTSYAPGNAPGNAPANAPASAPSAAPPAHREGDDGILGNRH